MRSLDAKIVILNVSNITSQIMFETIYIGTASVDRFQLTAKCGFNKQRSTLVSTTFSVISTILVIKGTEICVVTFS